MMKEWIFCVTDGGLSISPYYFPDGAPWRGHFGCRQFNFETLGM